MMKLIVSISPANYTHISYSETYKALMKNEKLVITPQICFVSPTWVYHGYEIIVKSENKEINILELLSQGEIRLAQAWDRMVLAGVFDLELPYEDED